MNNFFITLGPELSGNTTRNTRVIADNDLIYIIKNNGNTFTISQYDSTTNTYTNTFSTTSVDGNNIQNNSCDINGRVIDFQNNVGKKILVGFSHLGLSNNFTIYGYILFNLDLSIFKSESFSDSNDIDGNGQGESALISPTELVTSGIDRNSRNIRFKIRIEEMINKWYMDIGGLSASGITIPTNPDWRYYYGGLFFEVTGASQDEINVTRTISSTPTSGNSLSTSLIVTGADDEIYDCGLSHFMITFNQSGTERFLLYGPNDLARNFSTGSANTYQDLLDKPLTDLPQGSQEIRGGQYIYRQFLQNNGANNDDYRDHILVLSQTSNKISFGIVTTKVREVISSGIRTSLIFPDSNPNESFATITMDSATNPNFSRHCLTLSETRDASGNIIYIYAFAIDNTISVAGRTFFSGTVFVNYLRLNTSSSDHSIEFLDKNGNILTNGNDLVLNPLTSYTTSSSDNSGTSLTISRLSSAPSIIKGSNVVVITNGDESNVSIVTAFTGDLLGGGVTITSSNNIGQTLGGTPTVSNKPTRVSISPTGDATLGRSSGTNSTTLEFYNLDSGANQWVNQPGLTINNINPESFNYLYRV